MTTTRMPMTLLDRPAARVPQIDDDLTRRRLLSGIGALGLSVTLAGCAEDEETAGASAAPPPASPSPTGPFPVRIDHSFGTTEIASEPRRVVTVGFNDMDALFALGVAPVASRAWFTNEVIHPWSAEVAAGAATINIPNADGINFEAIAAADPDLITVVFASLTREEYDTLSAIAPTLAWPAQFDQYETPWQEQTRIIGRALGREAKADELIAEVEAAYAAAAARHPEWAGASVVYTSQYVEGKLLVYPGNTPATNFLELLGFVVPEELDEFFDASFDVVALSAERLDLIDRDLIVSDSTTEDLEAAGYFDLPTYQNLDAVREGRVLYPEKEISDGMSFRTVLSVPWTLERLEDSLAAAFRGETPPTPGASASPSPSTPPIS